MKRRASCRDLPYIKKLYRKKMIALRASLADLKDMRNNCGVCEGEAILAIANLLSGGAENI